MWGGPLSQGEGLQRRKISGTYNIHIPHMHGMTDSNEILRGGQSG